jgi:hypothetical protein
MRYETARLWLILVAALTIFGVVTAVIKGPSVGLPIGIACAGWAFGFGTFYTLQLRREQMERGKTES